ncbi:unnamed protein product [Porites lobata]|uniref:K Homology domain-containing protein n=1 Tax=Porites lobata TaxID=104759 RepID=A0ABN8PHV1_9CNID|nr:unnamed protein product [Porites lobata]
MSSFRGRNQKRRARGDQNWYDKSMATLTSDQEEEIVEIPKEKVGLVIGRKGRTKEEIRRQTGVQIFIEEDGAHLRGTAEQIHEAKTMIGEILNPMSHREGRPRGGGFEMLQNLMVPQHLIGQVLGKGGEKLRAIETKIGVSIKIIGNNFHIKGADKKEEKLARREIQESVNRAMKYSQRAAPLKFVHVDTAQLEENHELYLSVAPTPITNASLGEYYYKPILRGPPLKEETLDGFLHTDRLKEKIVKVLKQIHQEKAKEEVRVDMWCHFGRAYITKVDEDELEHTFTLEEFKEKLEDGKNKSWKSFFVEGVEDMEVLDIEQSLSSKAAKEDIRHDLTFYTPTCRDVRVKVWLTEPEGEEAGEAASSMAFSRRTPITVKNIRTRVMSDEQGDTSDTPCFHICSQFQSRLRADILIPSQDLDCRLSIRTCTTYVPKTPQDEEEDKILEAYLTGMRIEGGQLRLPPASELQDGFDLFYKRRSLRKTYQYEMSDGEQFSLTVCKDQATNVCPYEPDASSIDDIPSKADIHLHCDEWDRLLDEGNWEPEQIADKLPAFLEFLRQVQSSVVVRHG